MANDTVVTTKTKADRQAELSKILQDIVIDNTTIPQSVLDIAIAIDKVNIKELLLDNMVIDSNKINAITTKKGNKLYEIYSTGYGLQPLKRAGKHTIEAKISLFIR